MSFVIVCAQPGYREEGAWLASYDPDWIPDPAPDGWEANPVTGLATWTRDPDQAMSFVTAQAAYACWHTQSAVMPLRVDGRPNRPLTAFTVSIDRLE